MMIDEGRRVSPTPKAEHNISGISPVDVQVPRRVQEPLRHEVFGLRVQFRIAHDIPGETIRNIQHRSRRNTQR